VPVPDFQTIMLPLLRNAADGKERTSAAAREELAKEFDLTEAEKNELLPSGRQSASRIAARGPHTTFSKLGYCARFDAAYIKSPIAVVM